MLDVPDDIDAAIAEFKHRSDALDAKLAEMKAEQLAGRTGLSLYLEAKSMQAEVNACAATLRDRIQQVLREL